MLRCVADAAQVSARLQQAWSAVTGVAPAAAPAAAAVAAAAGSGHWQASPT
jgi:hypothetical protein